MKYRAAFAAIGLAALLHSPAQAAKDDLVRIVDESGEDYLFHKDHFVFVDFPKDVKKKIRAAAKI